MESNPQEPTEPFPVTATIPKVAHPRLEVFDVDGVRRISLADKLLWGAVGTTVVLGGIHAALELTWRFRHAVPHQLRELFLINQEQSIATWLSVFMTGLVGLLCLSAGVNSRRRGWLALGALFLYLSMDDATMLHERVGWLSAGVLGKDGFAYRWVQVLGPVLAVLGLFALRFLWQRFRHRATGRRRLLLAFGMLGSSLILEVFEKHFSESAARFRGFPISSYTIWLEECFELLAPALLLSCMIGLHEVGCGKLRDAAR